MSPKLLPTVLSPYPSPINSRSQSPLPPRQESIENSGNESGWTLNQPGAGGPSDVSSSLYAPPRPLLELHRKDGPLVISVADFSPSSNTSTTTSFCADPELGVDWRNHQSSASSSRSHSSASSSRSRSRQEDLRTSISPSASVQLDAADIPHWREVVSVAWADLTSEMGTLSDLACELHRNLYCHTNLADTVHERSLKLVDMINEGVVAIGSTNPEVGLSTCGQKYKKLWHGSKGIRIPRTVDALVSLNRTFVQPRQTTQPPTPAAHADIRFPPLPEAQANATADAPTSPVAEAKVLGSPTLPINEAWKCFFQWLAHGAKI
jgi:hypothetical protein